MKKGILRKTPKHRIERCSHEVQKLKDSIRGSVKSDYLDWALKEIEKLPILNKSPISVRNKKGVLIEIVGRHGNSIKLPSDYCRGVWYFDGNKLGKRKREHAKAMFSNTEESISEDEWNVRTKVWHKMEKSNSV